MDNAKRGREMDGTGLSCTRCGKAFTENSKLEGWVGSFLDPDSISDEYISSLAKTLTPDGILVDLVCPDCQTDEDRADALIGDVADISD